MSWLLALLFVASSLAGDLSFGYTASPEAGEDPALVVSPARALSMVTVVIETPSGNHERVRRGVGAGEQVRFTWPRDTSVTSVRAWITAEFADGTSEEVVIPMELDWGGGLAVDLSTARADVGRRVLSVEVTGRVERAEVVAYGAHRAQLSTRTVEIGQGPGTVEVPWVGDPGRVVVLDVTLHGSGGWAGFTYSPWFLDIPHNDVLFETNRAEILPAEEPKLEQTLADLADVLDKYGEIVPVKLYIAGCTDTVGPAAHNRDLSRQRAKSIATWLRQHGYRHPIYYWGFGEDLLAVGTGDGVDEAANRRALYLVSANPPPAGSGIPPVSWIELGAVAVPGSRPW